MEEMSALPEGSFSLIVAHAVIQYLPRPELEGLLAQWRRLLQKGGSLLMVDLVAPGVTWFSDFGALLDRAFRNGFFLAALPGLARVAMSRRRRLWKEPVAYGEDEILALLEAARLPASRVRPNVGLNPQRMAFQAYRLR